MQLLLAATIAACAAALLYRYAQYGQSGATACLPPKETDVSFMPQTNDGEEASPDASQMIRVLIKSQDFASDFHDKVVLSCKKGCVITDQSGVHSKKLPGESWQITGTELGAGDTLCIEGVNGAKLALESIVRESGVPQYHGKLYLTGNKEGITVVNEVPLEQYLYSVVSSEMPSSYPAEALKAQAVCARTYARNCIQNNRGKQPCDLDDSVSFQVYNNQQLTKASKKAVQETAGVILPLEEIQYYSTSGLTEKRSDLGDEASFRDFLDTTPDPTAQYGSAWIRWSVTVPVASVTENLEQARKSGTLTAQPLDPAQTAPCDDAQQTLSIEASKREGNGQLTLLTLTCAGYRYSIEGEYMIRKILGSPKVSISLQDGSVTDGMSLLPSAFFIIENQDGGSLSIRGCGYGHGNGMSQCGAAQMAAEGLDYTAILKYYYGVAPIHQNETADRECGL